MISVCHCDAVGIEALSPFEYVFLLTLLASASQCAMNNCPFWPLKSRNC